VSGELVGEVIAAASDLKVRGLSERGFHALIAIAEKCQAQTRQGSVRWDHIRAGLFGASLATAKRAVVDLKSAGVIRLVKRGFDNHAGRACAPIYEIQPLGERVTQVNQSPHERTGQIGGRTGQIGGRTGHPGDLLDGSIDGSIDGGACVTDEPNVPATTEPPLEEISDEEQPQPPDLEPPEYCPAHMPHGTDEKCGPCGSHRKHWNKCRARRDEAIRKCGLCDDRGGVGLRAGPFIKCPHDKQRIDELEEYHQARESA
jgi:hypothetical protein